MFELQPGLPAERRWTQLSEALEALDALSVSVEDADAQTSTRKGPCLGSPAWRRPPRRLGAARAVAALFDDP
jgi:hypothetical protein